VGETYITKGRESSHNPSSARVGEKVSAYIRRRESGKCSNPGTPQKRNLFGRSLGGHVGGEKGIVYSRGVRSKKKGEHPVAMRKKGNSGRIGCAEKEGRKPDGL